MLALPRTRVDRADAAIARNTVSRHEPGETAAGTRSTAPSRPDNLGAMITGALTQVAQRTEDLDRAVEFYGSILGLRLVARFDPPGIAFFDLDGTRLLLGDGNLSSMLYLAVDDIDATVTRLAGAGVVFEQGAHLIHTDAAGEFGAAGTEDWMAFFRDSEGNLLGLVERRPPA